MAPSEDQDRKLDPHHVYAAFDERHLGDWQSMVGAIVEHVVAFVDELDEAHEKFTDALEDINDAQLTNRLMDAEYWLRLQTLLTATNLGWALHATWTGRIEDLDDWAKRACEYAGIETVPAPWLKRYAERRQREGEPGGEANED